jgi:hypothetical protein
MEYIQFSDPNNPNLYQLVNTQQQEPQQIIEQNVTSCFCILVYIPERSVTAPRIPANRQERGYPFEIGDPRNKSVTSYKYVDETSPLILLNFGSSTRPIDVPGGGRNAGESTVAAGNRELREETGVSLTVPLDSSDAQLVTIESPRTDPTQPKNARKLIFVRVTRNKQEFLSGNISTNLAEKWGLLACPIVIEKRASKAGTSIWGFPRTLSFLSALHIQTVLASLLKIGLLTKDEAMEVATHKEKYFPDPAFNTVNFLTQLFANTNITIPAPRRLEDFPVKESSSGKGRRTRRRRRR